MVRYSFFKHGDKNKAREAYIKGAHSRRSTELKKAWEDSEKIKNLYKDGMSVQSISKQYNIHPRSCYRIIKL